MQKSKFLIFNFLFSIFLLLCCSCSSFLVKSDCEPITGILGAFQKEVIILEEQLTDAQKHQIEGMKFVTGTLKDRRVVIAWTGIGKVNTAMTTTLLIEHFKPNEIIFTGIAGGINPELAPGDIVIAEQTAYHDMGIMWPDEFEYRGVINPFYGRRNPVFFPADGRLLELAEKAAKQVELMAIDTREEKAAPKIVKGVIVTGDVFIASSQKCNQLRQQLKADAVEMEGAAVAQICYQRKIPHLVIRSISDKGDEKAREDSMMFQEMAAKNSACLIIEIVRLLGSKI